MYNTIARAFGVGQYGHFVEENNAQFDFQAFEQGNRWLVNFEYTANYRFVDLEEKQEMFEKLYPAFNKYAKPTNISVGVIGATGGIIRFLTKNYGFKVKDKRYIKNKDEQDITLYALTKNKEETGIWKNFKK